MCTLLIIPTIIIFINPNHFLTFAEKATFQKILLIYKIVSTFGTWIFELLSVKLHRIKTTTKFTRTCRL